MTILNVKRYAVGHESEKPEIITIMTDDTTATVTTTGYLSNAAAVSGLNFNNQQMALVYTTDEGPSWYQVSVGSSGVVSLVTEINPGSFIEPVSAKHFASFYDDTGVLQDLGWEATDPSYTKVVMQSGAAVVGNIPQNKDVAGSLEDSGIAANKIATTSFSNPDEIGNYRSLESTFPFSNLSGAGTHVVFTSSGTKQYIMRDLKLNQDTTNFSGGDRDIEITDGTLVWTVIPAATLQALVNAQWGSTDLPFPNPNSTNINTDSGASLFARYVGGTTDYTAGVLSISGIMERVS